MVVINYHEIREHLLVDEIDEGVKLRSVNYYNFMNKTYFVLWQYDILTGAKNL